MRVERLVGVISILALGCGKSTPPPPEKEAPAPAPVVEEDAGSKPAGSTDQSPIAPPGEAPKTPLKPLPTGPGPDTMNVPGYGDAVISVPGGVTHRVPVVVAVLGIGDTPETECGVWRELVGSRAFVLCPRGLPHYVDDAALVSTTAVPDQTKPIHEPTESNSNTSQLTQVGYYVADVGSVEREVDAGLAALRERHGEYLADSVLYVGFSRGAFLGASVVAASPSKYPRAVLVEGGQTAWTEETAAAFAKSGGKRVLFACGRSSCMDESTPAAALLAKHDVETKVVFGDGEGHDYQHQVKEQLRGALDWVVDGDPAWRTITASNP